MITLIFGIFGFVMAYLYIDGLITNWRNSKRIAQLERHAHLKPGDRVQMSFERYPATYREAGRVSIRFWEKPDKSAAIHSFVMSAEEAVRFGEFLLDETLGSAEEPEQLACGIAQASSESSDEASEESEASRVSQA